MSERLAEPLRGQGWRLRERRRECIVRELLSEVNGGIMLDAEAGCLE